MKMRRERNMPIVPMNAMSDIAFLLLVFIMLVALINYRREVQIEYPEAESAKRTSAEKNLEIWVDRTGNLYLDGIPAGADAVKTAVGSVHKNSPDTRVHIIADKNTPYKNVNTVVETLQRFEYRLVSFVVKDD